MWLEYSKLTSGILLMYLYQFSAKDSLLSSLKVLLLESSSQSKFDMKPEYSNRVVALNQSTKSLMNSLNIWERVEDMRVQPVRYMQVGTSNFLTYESMQPLLCFHFSRSVVLTITPTIQQSC